MANNLWTAFIADNGSNEILAALMPPGGTWTGGLPIYQTSPFSPSLAYFKNRLYVAFITDDEDSVTGIPSNRIFLSSTADGVTWAPAVFFNQYSKCAPSLASWHDGLHIAFVANDVSDRILVYHSSTPDDATSWSANVPTGQTSSNAPSLAAHGPAGEPGKLYLAFVADNGSEDIFVSSLEVGGTWKLGPSTGQTCHFSPSLAGGDNLYLVFAAANGSKDLYLSSLKSDGSWSASVPVNQSTSQTPCAAAFNSGLSVGFIANDASDEVLSCSTAHPTTSWPSANVDLKEQSAAGPAIAAAPFSYTPVSPGPSEGDNNYLITNHDIKNPLRNMTVTVVVNQDLVNKNTYNGAGEEATGHPLEPNPGFTFQLNCQPPGTIRDPATGNYPTPGEANYTGPAPGPGQNVWGQYGVQLQGTQFSSWAENGLNGPAGPVLTLDLFNVPKAGTIPKGYKIEIKLVTDTSTKFVIEVLVNVWDENGHGILGGGGSTPVAGPWPLAVTANPAPMCNLQFNIGGFDNGQYSKFDSGSKSFPLLFISYKADDPLMVRGATNEETAENSNVSFSPLTAYPANPIIQYCLGS